MWTAQVTSLWTSLWSVIRAILDWWRRTESLELLDLPDCVLSSILSTTASSSRRLVCTKFDSLEPVVRVEEDLAKQAVRATFGRLTVKLFRTDSNFELDYGVEKVVSEMRSAVEALRHTDPTMVDAIQTTLALWERLYRHRHDSTPWANIQPVLDTVPLPARPAVANQWHKTTHVDAVLLVAALKLCEAAGFDTSDFLIPVILVNELDDETEHDSDLVLYLTETKEKMNLCEYMTNVWNEDKRKDLMHKCADAQAMADRLMSYFLPISLPS